MSKCFETTDVLGVSYAELDYAGATDVIQSWAQEGSRRVVVVAPVSSLMMSRWRNDLGRAFDRADMVTADGVPIVWARRLMGRSGASRLYGPDLTLSVMQRCEQDETPIALLGGRPERLEGLKQSLAVRFPRLGIAYAVNLPIPTARSHHFT